MIIIYVVTKKFVSVQNFITFFTLNDDILSYVISMTIIYVFAQKLVLKRGGGGKNMENVLT